MHLSNTGRVYLTRDAFRGHNPLHLAKVFNEVVDHIMRDSPSFFESGSHHSAQTMQKRGTLQQHVEVHWNLHGTCSVDDAFNCPVEELTCGRRATIS